MLRLSKPFRHIIILFITISAGITNSDAQEADSYNRILSQLDERPNFTAFKDNFGTIGTTIGHRATSTNSDSKYQLSIMERFTDSKLIWDTHFFFQFTMVSYLNVFEPSFPLHDISVNPGFGLGKHLIRDGKHIGYGYLMIEHESNGFDGEGEKSRSWNKIALAATMRVTPNVELQFKGWYPIIDGRYSQHILRYQGLFFVASILSTNDKRLNLSTMLTPTYRKRIGINSQFELNYKLMKDRPVFVIAQYHNGYGENLLDYNIYKSRLRVGFTIKPDGFYIF